AFRPRRHRVFADAQDPRKSGRAPPWIRTWCGLPAQVVAFGKASGTHDAHLEHHARSWFIPAGNKAERLVTEKHLVMRPGTQPGHSLSHREDSSRLSAAPVAAHEQPIEIASVQLPAPYGPAIEMDEMRARIPADAPPLHGKSRLLHPGKIPVEGDVDAPAIDMLAVLGHAEGGGPEPLIGGASPIGRR